MVQNPPHAWGRNLAALLDFADAAADGDRKHPSGAKHALAEPWMEDWASPVYDDSTAAKLRKHGGVEGLLKQGKEEPDDDYAARKVAVTEELRTFAERHRIDQLSSEVKQGIHDLSDDRRIFITNLVNALDLARATVMSPLEGIEKPSFDDRYRSTTLHQGSVELLDPTGAKANLRKLLARRGFHQPELLDAVAAWEERYGRVIPSDDIQAEVDAIMPKVVALTKKQLLGPLGIEFSGHYKRLVDVPFNALNFSFFAPELGEIPAYITGSHTFFGGEQDGIPLLRSIFEYNPAYHMTFLSLIALCMHEFVPGHDLNAVTADLLYRDGKFGFESTMHTMASPQTALWEGLAQNALTLLFGDRETAYQHLGALFYVEPIDFAISYAVDDMIDIAKHDGPILYQREGWDQDRVIGYVQELGLTGAFPTKILGWATNDVIGSMYGVGYEKGKQAVARAIQQYDRFAVARAGFGISPDGTFAITDVQTFRHMLERR